MSVRLEDCIEAEDRAWIATIHSVAQRILEKYGHTVGLPAELHIYDCSGQAKLATALEFFQNNRSDSFGVKPPLY
ncbi:UvrD-helicase domain-containing protein [Yersinia hibernica]|uniref:UvrD-helicase domain-containing protein n=1 Tax=Yersinia hibernica TaxID=2339259 RepID=UPI002B20EEFA|nr:UvrD-helicase domain-containing protein [Yersinia hibernica]